MTTTIKLDFDHNWKLVIRKFQKVGWICKRLGFSGLDGCRTYQTKKGYHVELKIKKKLRQWEILYLQILFGSDIQREALNFLRLRRWGDSKNHLFDTKYFFRKGRFVSYRSRKYMPKLSRELSRIIYKSPQIDGGKT